MALFFNHSNFLQTIFFVFLFFMITCTRSLLLSHDDECLALYQFMESVHHQDLASFSSSWKITSNASNNNHRSQTDCCLWDGVKCSNEGRVISLDLSDSSLYGTLNSNSTLFSLVHLQTLNLASNDFGESHIPPEIGSLKKLKCLNLSYSGFSGQIPYEIGELIHLSLLDLSHNPLKLQSPSFEKLVQNLTRLEALHLSQIDISSSVPHFLANFSSLRSIWLNNCGLQKEFPPAIIHLPKLKSLRVSNNMDLTGFFHEFRNDSLLEELFLYDTGFFGMIPDSISNLNHLKYLNLGECSFSGRIPSSISNLTQLTGFGVHYNEFTSNVPSLVTLSELRILDVGGNKFENKRFPNWLGKLTNLIELHVDDMNLYGEMPRPLINLTKLEFLYIDTNFFFGPIPSWLFNLTQLKGLVLQENKFSGKANLDMFLRLNELETLLIGYNKISLVSTNNFTIATLPQLELIDLTSCNLKEFPAFLRFQHQINALLLADNKIDGFLPVWSWNNSKETLQFFDLSYNYITGNIPPALCEMKSLLFLDLSFNNMSGTLPHCLGSLSNSMMSLNLNRNNFEGAMMDAFTHANMLRHLDLSKNQFTGHVSKSLANCTNLEFLSLQENSFNDIFPFSLGTLPNLQVLLLQSNKLYGAVHDLTLVSSPFPKLRIVDLSNNRFSGQLPEKYFQTWNAMKSHYDAGSFLKTSLVFLDNTFFNSTYKMTLTYKGQKTEYAKILDIFIVINLSCNNFEGQIPQSLQDLQGLESLNLSHNHFAGGVLSSLGKLRYLESLDLSHNKLSGEIPQQLVKLTFLAIFNVSFNHLYGLIPTGNQFNTFENNSYMGNPGLCGRPLSKECQISKTSKPLVTSNKSVESLLPSETIDWIVLLLGFGSGLLVGTIIGNLVYARYHD